MKINDSQENRLDTLDEKLAENNTPAKQSTIDWGALLSKIQKNQDEINHFNAITLEQKVRILKKRAEALASTEDRSPARFVTETLEFLEFRLGDERYGLETDYVYRVCPLKDLTVLPKVPSYMMGIINVHGEIIPVYDLKQIFELPNKEISVTDQVVVIKVKESVFGLYSEEVCGLMRINQEDLQTGLLTITGLQMEYLKGVTVNQTAIIDPIKLLSDKKIVINATF